MATPPAEAPSLAKEEKPQLPPSPNGVSSPNNVSGYVHNASIHCEDIFTRGCIH